MGVGDSCMISLFVIGGIRQGITRNGFFLKRIDIVGFNRIRYGAIGSLLILQHGGIFQHRAPSRSMAGLYIVLGHDNGFVKGLVTSRAIRLKLLLINVDLDFIGAFAIDIRKVLPDFADG